MLVNLCKHILKKKNAVGYLLALFTWDMTEPWIVHFINQNNAPFSRKRKVGKIKMSKLFIARKTLPVTVYAGIPEMHKYQ